MDRSRVALAVMTLTVWLSSAAFAQPPFPPPPGPPGGPPGMMHPPPGPPGMGMMPPPPPGMRPPPPVVIEDEPVCRLVRQRYWDGESYRTRRVEVCE